jgi:hypothetical protein
MRRLRSHMTEIGLSHIGETGISFICDSFISAM